MNPLELRYLVTRARRGEWTPGTSHPGMDEFVDGKPTGIVAGTIIAPHFLPTQMPPDGLERQAWFRWFTTELCLNPTKLFAEIHASFGVSMESTETKPDPTATNVSYAVHFDIQLGTYEYGEHRLDLPDDEPSTMRNALAEVESHFRGKMKITNAKLIKREYTETIVTKGIAGQ